MTTNGKDALHLATHSGWYRFERKGEDWTQTDRALTFWQMSCIQVDPENSKRVYIGTEHSGMFVTDDGGKDWTRANPNVPCLTMSSMLALSGKLLVGTMPAALYYIAEGGGWQELKGVRQGAVGGTFPPNPEFPARTRVLTREKDNGGRLFAGIEVGWFDDPALDLVVVDGVVPDFLDFTECDIGQNVVVSPDVVIGNNVKIQNNVSVYTGV